jgi:hypothetical protein
MANTAEQANIPGLGTMYPRAEVQIFDDLNYRNMIKIKRGTKTAPLIGSAAREIYIGPCVLYDIVIKSYSAANCDILVFDLATEPDTEDEDFIFDVLAGKTSSWTSAKGWLMRNGLWIIFGTLVTDTYVATVQLRPLPGAVVS